MHCKPSVSGVTTGAVDPAMRGERGQRAYGGPKLWHYDIFFTENLRLQFSCKRALSWLMSTVN